MAAGAIPVRLWIAAFTPAPRPPVANDDNPVSNLPACCAIAPVSAPKNSPALKASFIFANDLIHYLSHYYILYI